ncbi:MAG: Isoprenylcysteine carboxyl methyltransferase [Devosia sp.]|uniref:methyltransferase family protein n=1 Tax=Devosia sp. TaxID=1871048 RepID=UPI002634AE44|nr:isoprenylcysteine carboxylmethyltransferase family protein [Devosia sp.]MDB5542705.1 Isoprenylcysteine carboxyl methyltransferase [Devosia sp.]
MPDATHPRFGSEEYRALGSLAVTLIVMAVLLFVPAGTVRWARGWWYLAVFLAAVIIAMVYIWRVDPELFAIRRKPQAGTKSWDLAFVAVTLISMAAILPVAGLDYRFDWSQLPDGVVWLGYLIFACGFWLTAWAQGVNRHFELTVRIQTDRGHVVVDSGPYAVVRHPGYIGGGALGFGTALALGSLVALVPAIICIIALALRTLAEEATLSEELPGYATYMRKVRFRWVPGVW